MGTHSKKDNDKMALLLAEANHFIQNKETLTFSDNFPSELAGAIGGIGAGAVGVGTVLAVMGGMSAAEITGGLAAFGAAGMVGGVAAPVAIVGGGIYWVANQNKLGKELIELIKISGKYGNQLEQDDRENARKLGIAIKEYREELLKKHSDIVVL